MPSTVTGSVALMMDPKMRQSRKDSCTKPGKADPQPKVRAAKTKVLMKVPTKAKVSTEPMFCCCVRECEENAARFGLEP